MRYENERCGSLQLRVNEHGEIVKTDGCYLMIIQCADTYLQCMIIVKSFRFVSWRLSHASRWYYMSGILCKIGRGRVSHLTITICVHDNSFTITLWQLSANIGLQTGVLHHDMKHCHRVFCLLAKLPPGRYC